MSHYDDPNQWDVILKPPLGSHIEEVVEAVCKKAKKDLKFIWFYYQGILIEVSPGDLVEEVVERYQKKREASMKGN